MPANDLSPHVLGDACLSKVDAQQVSQQVQYALAAQDRTIPEFFDLVGFIEGIAQRSPRYGTLSSEAKLWCATIAERLAQRDITEDWIIAVFNAAIQSIRQDTQDLSYTQRIHLEELLISATTILQALLPTLPGSTTAEVVQVIPEGTDYAIVRLRVDPAELQAGYRWETAQSIGVHTHLQPGHWREYTVATPPNPRGEIELQVHKSGVQSRLLMHTKPGDRLHLTPGHGGFECAALDYAPVDLQKLTTRKRLYVAHDTGFAPFQAMLLDQIQLGKNSPVKMVISADYPGQLYPLMNLWQYASISPWLQFLPLSVHAEDAWWVDPAPAAQPANGMPRARHAEAGKFLAAQGTWSDHDVFLAGPANFVYRTRKAFIAGGTPAEQIYEISYRPSAGMLL